MNNLNSVNISGNLTALISSNLLEIGTKQTSTERCLGGRRIEDILKKVKLLLLALKNRLVAIFTLSVMMGFLGQSSLIRIFPFRMEVAMGLKDLIGTKCEYKGRSWTIISITSNALGIYLGLKRGARKVVVHQSLVQDLAIDCEKGEM